MEISADIDWRKLRRKFKKVIVNEQEYLLGNFNNRSFVDNRMASCCEEILFPC